MLQACCSSCPVLIPIKIFTFFLPSWTDFLKYLVSADLLKSDKRFALDIMDHAVSEEKQGHSFSQICAFTLLIGSSVWRILCRII